MNFITINEDLISEVTGYPPEDFASLQELNLHLSDDPQDRKIRKIEHLSILPNLRRLNLSYNAISKIEGLDRLVHLSELNLAENNINRIENLDYLKSLQKLNLSGNVIERIPATIRQLHQLNHLRITRNNLSHIEDIQHLAHLPYLTNLRIDENPLCDDSDYDLFITYHVPTLLFLNGREISDEMREAARLKFATSQRDLLVSKLDAEKHKLARLKRNLQRSSPVRRSSPAGTTRPNEEDEDDEEPQIMAQKLEEIELVSKEIDQLQELVHRFDRGQSPEIFRRSTDDFDRLKSNVATPMRSSHIQASSAPNSSFRTPQGDSLAAKQITELQDRIELLATKVLTTEKEKSTLKKELDAHRKSDNVVQRLTDELMITEESLEKALRAAKDAHEELDDVRGELTVTRGHLEESEGDVQRLTKENTALREDNQQLQRENRDLLRLVEDLEAKAAAKPPPPPPSWSAVDDWRAEQKQQRHHEDYATVLELQRINIHLQAELDRHLQESTTLTQHLMRSREETDQLKRTLVDYEARDRDARTEKHHCERTIQALQTERSNLQRTIGTLESNIKALESDLAAIIRAKNNTPMKPTSSSSLASSRRALATPKRTLKAATGGRPMTFLDAWSSESDVDQSQQLAEDGGGGAAASESSRYLDRVHLSSSGRKTPRRGATATGAAPATMKFSLTELERSAAEIMAHIMLEELQQMQSSGSSGSSGGGENKSKSPAATKRLVRPDDLKDACIRAALRLVYTSTNLVQDPELQRAMAEELDTSDPHHHSNSNSNSAPHRRVKFTPFHALGDRHVLSKLVADTHAGLTAMEEAAMYRDDINQLEKLARELELRAENADRSIVEKDNILKGLQRHAEEAKRQAEETLHELDNLHKKLQQGRDEVVRLDNEQQMLKREVDIARGHMKDTTALSELEQRNLTSLRERVQDMKREQGTLESTLLGLRDQHAKEEAKVRAIRATSTEQLRLLQVDVSKLAHEFKAKQRAMEDLDKHRRAVEEETETKKRDTETLLSTLHREVEDETRKLSAARNEQRYLRTEVESWHAKRKQAEADYALIHEKYTTEHSKYETEELDIRRKLDQGDRLLQEQERKGKTLREKCAALEQEQTALRHSVDELRRQQTDVERSLDTKRRTTEAELQQAQHSAQLANRSLRQLSTQLEQKQHEYEAMCAECRTQERRVEELKRLVREHEGRVEHQRELSKALELERVQATKELAQTKRDDEELRHQQLLMKNTVETEARAVEETRRRLLALTADVEHMQETETRGRQQLHTIQTELDAVQQELLACRAQQDRERRLLSELTAKRALLDAETHRQQESLRCVTERTHAEHHRTQEVEQSMLKSIEELNRAQKTLVQLEKKIDEAQRRAEETTQRETHVKQQIAKWQLEVDGLHALYTTEKRHVETVREEGRRLTSEQHRYQEELQALTLQTKEYRVEMETTQRFVEHQQAVKLALEQEIHRLQETNRWEQQRLATASEQYQSLEQHLQRLRHELEALQATYTKTKHETVEEARRTEQQRRLLQATLTDMMALETRMSEIKQGLARDKQRAMAEIGQLQQVKQNTEQQILLLGETQRRLDRHHQWNVQQHPPVVVVPPSASSSSLSSSSLWKTTETRLPSAERSRSRSRSRSQSPSRSRSRSPTGGASYLNVKTMTATPPVFTVTALPHRSSSTAAAAATSSTAASLIPAATVAKEMYRLKVSLADDDRLHSDDSGDDVFQRRGRWVAHRQQQQQQQQQQQRPVDHDHDEEEDTRPNQRSRSASACASRRDSLDEYDDAHDAATTSASASAAATAATATATATGSRSVHFATRPTMTTALEDISDDFSVSSVDVDGGGERDSLGAWPTTTTATTANPFSFSSTLPAESGSPPSSASATNKDSLVTAASTAGGGGSRGGVSGSAFVSDEDADHHDDDEDDWSDSNAGRLSSLQEAIRQLREQSEAVLAQSSSSGSSPSSGSGR